MPYCYDNITLTCPFCKSKMVFQHILVDDLKLPYYADYICDNKKCNFELEIQFKEFEKRIRQRFQS